jgi:hypothetical protein
MPPQHARGGGRGAFGLGGVTEDSPLGEPGEERLAVANRLGLMLSTVPTDSQGSVDRSLISSRR